MSLTTVRLRSLLPLVALAATLAACSSDTPEDAASQTSSPSASASASPSSDAAPTPVSDEIDVKATGGFGDKPTLTVPDGDAPQGLRAKVLEPGDGAVVNAGDLLVVNYLGQTWAPKDGKPNVFDNSYDRGEPTAFPIGIGDVIPGWDGALVGQKAGSRVLLSIPPEDGYGTDSSAHELGGQTLVFVVDIIKALPKDSSASGTVVKDVPDGFPKVTNESGKMPSIESVEGVTPGKEARSTMLIEGDGAPINAEGTLAVQLMATDTATGTNVEQTWDTAVRPLPAAQVLTFAPELKGKKVGSRVLVITPDEGTAGSGVLIIDIVDQITP